MNASVSAHSKLNGPPAGTARGIRVGMLWPPAVLDEIEQWAAAQPDKPNRSEAILRLVQQALAGAACQQSENSPTGLTDVLKAAGASRATAARPVAPLPPPKRDSGRADVDVGQTTHEVRWKPRVVEASRIPQLAEAQTLAKPGKDGKFYEMPEDIRAFNEYWNLAELILRRHLQYEEVLLAYNRYRQDERHRPVLPLTDKDLE
jgi:hypothetical protein